METLNRVSRELDKRTALIGFAGGPLTIAAYMVDGSGGGFPATRRMMDNNPGLLDSLIGKLTDAVIGLLVAQIDAGGRSRPGLRQLGRPPGGRRQVHALVDRSDKAHRGPRSPRRGRVFR